MACLRWTVPQLRQVVTIFCMFVCLFFGNANAQAKLNVARLLLPVASTAVTNFTLEVSDGCYQWSSTRPEVANVEPVYDDNDQYGLCSAKAVVTAQWRGSKRATSILWADDGKVRLRCDVIVDAIDSVQIVTRTRELFLEDAPDVLEVTAKNSQGDTFSTLDGVEFEWRLITDEESRLSDGSTIDVHQVLRFVKWDDTAYETPRAIGPLERDGRQGYKVLVEGIQTGSAKVSVKPRHSSLADVKPDIIRLIVVANLQLKPTDVYVVPHAIVRYSVDQIRQGKAEPVLLPSQRMRLQLKDETICVMNNLTSSVYCKLPGTNTVTLRDTNIRVKPDSYTPPTSNIFVVKPAYLALMITPGRVPVLELHREYVLEVQIFDSDSNAIYATDNLLVDLQIEQKQHLKIIKKLSSTTFQIAPLKVGKVRATGLFAGVVDERGTKHTFSTPLQRDVTIDIFEPMSIDPEVAIFPYDPASRSDYAVTFKVSGGSGDFAFSSSNTTVARVSKHEYGVAHAGGVSGNSTIRAVDLKNIAHGVSAQIYVLPVDGIAFQPVYVEQEVGQVLELPVGLFGTFVNQERVPFTDCRHVLLGVTFSEPSVFVDVTHTASSSNSTVSAAVQTLSTASHPGCTTFRLKANTVGTTVLTATYPGGKQLLQASITIASYPALQIVYPAQSALLTPGSSVSVLLEGGPMPWTLNVEAFTRQFEALPVTVPEGAGKHEDQKHRSILRAVEVMEKRGEKKKQHAFRVYCTGYGRQIALFTVTNRPSESNAHPRQVTQQLEIRCEWPLTMQMRPRFGQLADSSLDAQFRQNTERPRDLPACPLTDDGRRAVPVPTQGNIDILVDALDRHGKSFNNFSSLSVRWTLTDGNLATLVSPASVSFDRIIPRLAGTNLPTTSKSGTKQQYVELSGPVWIEAVKHLTLLGRPGDVWLEAMSESFNSDYLKDAHSHMSARHKPDGTDAAATSVLRDALHLQLVPEPTMSPKSLTIYNYETNHQQLVISGGSDFFFLQLSRPQLIRAAYDEAKRTIDIAPRLEGKVELRAYDLCLYAWRPAIATIDVVDVARIEVVALDRVEVGKSVPLRVRMFDADGSVLPISRYAKWAQLQGVTQPEGIVNLQENATSSSAVAVLGSDDADGLIYMIYGHKLGRTRIHFEARKRSGSAPSQTTPLSSSVAVTSNVVAFQVFSPLILDPKNLTLVKSSDFQMAYSGGPQPSSDVKFLLASPAAATAALANKVSSANVVGSRQQVSTRVAEIDKLGTLHALDYGRINVIAQLDAVEPVTGQRIILTRDEAEIHVVKLSGIKIFAPLSTIEVGHEMPLMIEGLARGITGRIFPLSFAGTRPPQSLTFTWAVDNKEIASVHGVLQPNGITLAGYADATMRFYAKSPGEASVRLVVRDPTGNILAAEELRDQLNILVVAPLFVRSKYNNEFLMTPNSKLTLYSSRDGQAQMLYDQRVDAEIIDVDERGEVTSHDATGEALVKIFAQESSGSNAVASPALASSLSSALNRSFTATVAVRDVVYLTTSVDGTVWKAKSDAPPLRAVPLGATFTLRVVQHDLYGRKFDSNNIELRFRPNKFSLLPISFGSDNGTLVVKAANVGRTVIKLWDAARPHLIDFVNIVVESVITPSSDAVFTIGDVICFQCQLMPPNFSTETSLALVSPTAFPTPSASAGGAKKSLDAGKWEIATLVSPSKEQQQQQGLSASAAAAAAAAATAGGYDLMVLNPDSGIAVPVRPGAATVTYTLPSIGTIANKPTTGADTFSAKVDISIVPLSSIKFVAMSRLGMSLALRNINTHRMISSVTQKLGRVFLPVTFNGASTDANAAGLKAVRSAELLKNCQNAGMLPSQGSSGASTQASMPPTVEKLAYQIFWCSVDFSFPTSTTGVQIQSIRAMDFFDVRPVFMPEALMFGCLVEHTSLKSGSGSASTTPSMDVLQVLSALDPVVNVRAHGSKSSAASTAAVEGDTAPLQFLPHFMPTQRELIIVASETLQTSIEVFSTRAVADNIEIRLDPTGGADKLPSSTASHAGPKTAADNAIHVSALQPIHPGKFSFAIRIRDVTALYESGYVAASTGTISVRLILSCQLTGQEEPVTLKLKLDDLTLEQLVARQRSWVSYITPAASTVMWGALMGLVLLAFFIGAAMFVSWQSGVQRQAFEWATLLRGAGIGGQPAAPAPGGIGNSFTTPQRMFGTAGAGPPVSMNGGSASKQNLFNSLFGGGNDTSAVGSYYADGQNQYDSFHSNISSPPNTGQNGNVYGPLRASGFFGGSNSQSLENRLLNSSLHNRSGSSSAGSSNTRMPTLSGDATIPANYPIVPPFMASRAASAQSQQHRTTPSPQNSQTSYSRYREHQSSGGESDDEAPELLFDNVGRVRPFDAYSTTSTTTTSTLYPAVPPPGIGRAALRPRNNLPSYNRYGHDEDTWTGRTRGRK